MPAVPLPPRTRLETLVSRGLLSLPATAQRRLARGAPVRVDGNELDPEMQLLLALQELDGRPEVEELSVADARAQIRLSALSVAGRPTPMARVEARTVQGAAGPLDARLYVPAERAGDQRSPLLVYFHGGGWVVGDLDTVDATCRLLADAAGVRVLSVAYRLAPEHPFPAAADDALAAFRDAAATAAALGADPGRIAVGGDSAGGNIATAAALAAVADGGPAPAFQLLIYPATDNAADHRSTELFAEGFFLTRESIRWFRDHYVADADRRDPQASPLLAPELAGVAPAYIATAGFDPLRDEGEAYAARLREAGVAVTLRRHPGLIHGFANVLVGRCGREALREAGGALRTGL